MNALSTAAAVTVLATTTAAFGAQSKELSSSPSRLVSNAGPSAYRSHSAISGRQYNELDTSSDAASCRAKGEPVKGSATSAAFAATAAQDGMVEVALAELALQKSHSAQVRQFAKQMAKDYAQSNTRLDSIVKCEGLVLPTKLDATHKAAITRLEATSGEAFDQAYLKHIAEKHSKAVALLESASKSGDHEVAAFARNSLSMLQKHQERADDLRVG